LDSISGPQYCDKNKSKKSTLTSGRNQIVKKSHDTTLLSNWKKLENILVLQDTRFHYVIQDKTRSNLIFVGGCNNYKFCFRGNERF